VRLQPLGLEVAEAFGDGDGQVIEQVLAAHGERQPGLFDGLRAHERGCGQARGRGQEEVASVHACTVANGVPAPDGASPDAPVEWPAMRTLPLLALALWLTAAGAAEPLSAPAEAASAPPVSLSARKVYEQARSQLLQIRTVLKGRASQTSVGSGFVVSAEGHIITNFHVVSEMALEPATHDLVYVTADGREARLDVLML